MSESTYFRDHWAVVEPERIETYEMLFQWRPEMEGLLAPAEVGAGQIVVDYGCGPGHLSVELGRRVGHDGRVHAADINSEFLARTRKRADEEAMGNRIETHELRDEHLPLREGSVDRVVCKNVLEYVPDLDATVREFRRVLRPGGIAHAIDSDWGLLVIEPLGASRLSELMSAANVAFKTPMAGRKLYGSFCDAGFEDVRVQVSVLTDTVGFLLPILMNMATYARASEKLAEDTIAGCLSDVQAGIQAGRHFALLPQFVVTGRA